MQESDFNYIIKTSLSSEGGFAFKISDPPKIATTSFTQNPFDGFSVSQKSIIFWEAKFQKGYKSFNFNSIKDHQIENLMSIYHNSDDLTIIYPLILLGVWESRKYFDCYSFHITCIDLLLKEGRKSILKKEFPLLSPYKIKIKKGVFNKNEIYTKTIFYSDFILSTNKV